MKIDNIYCPQVPQNLVHLCFWFIGNNSKEVIANVVSYVLCNFDAVNWKGLAAGSWGECDTLGAMMMMSCWLLYLLQIVFIFFNFSLVGKCLCSLKLRDDKWLFLSYLSWYFEQCSNVFQLRWTFYIRECNYIFHAHSWILTDEIVSSAVGFH